MRSPINHWLVVSYFASKLDIICKPTCFRGLKPNEPPCYVNLPKGPSLVDLLRFLKGRAIIRVITDMNIHQDAAKKAAGKVITSDGIKFNIHWPEIKKKKSTMYTNSVESLYQHVTYVRTLHFSPISNSNVVKILFQIYYYKRPM